MSKSSLKKKSRRKPYTPNSQIRAALRRLFLRSRERSAALKRDGYTCKRCDKKQSMAKGREIFVEVHPRKIRNIMRGVPQGTGEGEEIMLNHSNTYIVVLAFFVISIIVVAVYSLCRAGDVEEDLDTPEKIKAQRLE